jgi:hypothetical protein
VLLAFSATSTWGQSNVKAASDDGGSGVAVYVLPTGQAARAAVASLGSPASSNDNVAWQGLTAGAGLSVPSFAAQTISTCVTGGANIGGDPALTPATSTTISGGEYVALRGAAGDLSILSSETNVLSKVDKATQSAVALVPEYESGHSSAVLQQIAALDPALVKYNNFGQPSGLSKPGVKLAEQPSGSSDADTLKQASAEVHEILMDSHGQSKQMRLPPPGKHTLGSFQSATATAIRAAFPGLAALLAPAPAATATTTASSQTVPQPAATPATNSVPAETTTGPPESTATTTVSTAPLAALQQYWASIAAQRFAAAYGYLVPGSVGQTESQWVTSEREAGIAGVQFQGHVTSQTDSGATLVVQSLVTHDAHFGCRSWTGSYELTDQTGTWLIQRADITPSACT